MNRLIVLVESRIRGNVYVRFGGEHPKTHRSNTAGRWMLSLHIEAMQADPNFSVEASNGVYIVFLVIGIVGYFTIPTVAGWIIQAGGGVGSYNKNIGTAGALGGSLAGAAAGNVAGRTGKFIRKQAGRLLKRK